MCKPRSLGAKFMNTAAIIFWSTVTIVTFAFILRDVRAGYFDYGKKKREREKDKAPLSSALEDPVPYLTFTQEECELIDLQQKLRLQGCKAEADRLSLHIILQIFTRQTRQQPGSSLWLSPEGFLSASSTEEKSTLHLPPDGSLYLAAPQSEEQKSGVPSNLKPEEVRIIRRDDGLALGVGVLHGTGIYGTFTPEERELFREAEKAAKAGDPDEAQRISAKACQTLIPRIIERGKGSE
jgi:hypothetical protein